MLVNYIKIIVRNLIKFKGYTFINIAGLAIGISSCILILLWIQSELSYDQFHVNKENLYRAVQDGYIGSPAPLAPIIEERIPEILKTVRIDNFTGSKGVVFSNGDNRFTETKFYLVDPAFLAVFTFPLIAGDPNTALDDVNSIVITEELSLKYFGDTNSVGKILTYEGTRDFMVTGVMKNIPENTHLKFDVIVSFQNLPLLTGYAKYLESWGAQNFVTYFLAVDGVAPDVINDKMFELYKELSPNDNNPVKNYPYHLQKVTDIHLNSNLRKELSPNGNKSDVIVFTAIAFMVLLIGCINYMNLATARFMRRSKEVGIRKVVGAKRSQLIIQFLSEATILTIASTIIAIVIVEAVLPAFSQVLDRSLEFHSQNLDVIFGLMGLALVTGILSGSYPAFYLSSAKPTSILKSGMISGARGAAFRKILVVLQFSLSIFFIIFSITITMQVAYFDKMDLGFDKDQVLNIPFGDKYGPQYNALRKELIGLAGVKNVCFSRFLLSDKNYNQSTWWEGMPEDENESMRWFPVDNHFIETFDLELVKGNNFSGYSMENKQYIINESAAKFIGWDDPVGKQMDILGRGEVVGVVKDFNFRSLHHSVEPLILMPYPKLFTYASIKIAGADVQGSIADIGKIWKQMIPDRPFDYFFFDEDYDMMYKKEQKTSRVFHYASILAIIISSLGLFGLASFMIETRTKEIGVRKTLGASITNILTTLI